MNNYLEVNNIKDYKSDNFCLDFLFLLNFFGNDFLPSSLEIGPEISFNYLIKTYYQVFGKTNRSIIVPKYNNNNLTHEIDFNSFKDWLVEINKSSVFTKIFLLRYYKVPYNIVYILTERLNLNLPEIRDNILKPYLIFQGMINLETLENNDIRKILFLEYLKEKNLNINDKDLENKIKNPLTEGFPSSLTTNLEYLDTLLLQYLDFLDLKNYGLKNNSYNIDLDENMYQNLYNFISNESHISEELNNITFDYQIEPSNEVKVSSFLCMLYFIVNNFFNEMEFYKSTNLTKYGYKNIPSLNDIINFINTNEMDIIKKKFDDEIKSNILSKNFYIDSTLHHLIITPYLLDSNYLELLDNKDLLKKIIVNFNSDLQKIWCNNNNDLFIKEDPKHILRYWSDLLHKINSINKIENKNNILINV